MLWFVHQYYVYYVQGWESPVNLQFPAKSKPTFNNGNIRFLSSFYTILNLKICWKMCILKAFFDLIFGVHLLRLLKFECRFDDVTLKFHLQCEQWAWLMQSAFTNYCLLFIMQYTLLCMLYWIHLLMVNQLSNINTWFD